MGLSLSWPKISLSSISCPPSLLFHPWASWKSGLYSPPLFYRLSTPYTLPSAPVTSPKTLPWKVTKKSSFLITRTNVLQPPLVSVKSGTIHSSGQQVFTEHLHQDSPQPVSPSYLHGIALLKLNDSARPIRSPFLLLPGPFLFSSHLPDEVSLLGVISSVSLSFCTFFLARLHLLSHLTNL